MRSSRQFRAAVAALVLAGLPGALLAPRPALAGDVDDASFFARIELGPSAPGATTWLDLRTSAPGAPAAIFLAPSLSPLDPDGFGPLPYLRVFGPQSIVAVVGLDAAGRLRAGVPLPPSPALAGAHVFAQALVVTPGGALAASNVAATTVAPAPGTSFADVSFGLPGGGSFEFATHACAADLDLDGDPDLVVATDLGLRVWRNDGGFSFTDVSAQAVPAGVPADVFVVQAFDANLDGWPDLFVGAGPGDPVSPPLPNALLMNAAAAAGGAIAFVPAPLPDAPGVPHDVAAADFDLDGDLDLVLANGGDAVHSQEPLGSNVLLVNQGFAQGGVPGAFAVHAGFAAAAWNAPSSFNLGVAAGDFDDDGDLDLAFARSDTGAVDGVPGQPNLLIENLGNLTFADVTAQRLQPAFSDNARAARFADLDGDGDLDLLFAGSVTSIKSAQSGEYYVNDGTGHFTEAPSLFPQIDESELSIRLAVHVVDVDLDGDLDVFVPLHEFVDFDMSSGNPTGGDDLLFLNQGGAQGGTQGAFALDPTYTSLGVFTSADGVFADFDLDGDDDLYVPATGTLFGAPAPHALLMNQRL